MSVVLALAAQASAHKVTEKAAVRAAKASVAKIADETNATRSSVACKRRSSHRWACLATFQYRQGASRCELPIAVSAATHTSRRLRRVLGETLCY